MVRRQQRSALGLFFYALRYRVAEYLLRGFVEVLPRFPDRFALAAVRLLARVSFAVPWGFRRRMEENVAAALGEEFSSRAERKELIWRAWFNFARAVLDTCRATHLSPAHIQATVALEGEEHIKNALEQGRGVIALSAHLGPFAMIGPRLAAAGFPFSVVVKQPADERFARLLDGYRARVGVGTISAKPRREAVRGILKALRENRVVLIIADEFKSSDVHVDFLGLRVPAPRGPATLALRTGSVTLPMFAIRRLDGSLALRVERPIAPVEHADIEQSIAATTALFTRQLEAVIRRYPDQWNWLGLPRQGHRPERAALARTRKRRRTKKKNAPTPPSRIGSDTSSPM
jgi:KDO2-lipid IV(A) lauroyltransferase